ncbi:cation channel sperm-associated auxiliary subunit zeta [Perognathus longimembris pacificus]|uniref:cation channel sperm-associated auxiliary subunit zeta n=1 Tax=Perognathus longimembris pacificus TaxID=214514 RepID=UPI002019B56C|nr:cation channel sperm-associated auxiliary subunit zeta [Perognathus longimembris pacificus]
MEEEKKPFKPRGAWPSAVAPGSPPSPPRLPRSPPVCGPQGPPKPSERRSSSAGRASLRSGDIRNLWSTATLLQPQGNVSLAEICENFDDEGRDVGRIRRQKSQTFSMKEKLTFTPQELEEQALLDLELRGSSSIQGLLEKGAEDINPEAEKCSSESLINLSKHIPHRAYWTEQQNRLPLPLMELMENEALEILTKALKSYRSQIGKNHFLTKELQRYIEGLKKRQSKRLQCPS